MKISMFHLMPHRELPPDFETRYESVWVTPRWWELADARRVGQYYNWTIDELLYAAQCGFDGVCTNEHHQNAYGFMPSPNIMGSVLAKLTNGSNVAIVQMGATLPNSNPPIRVAEEYAMLDCISGGRLVAGLPLGSPMDVNFCYGITPMEHRERYREAFALTLKAWQAREIFDRQTQSAGLERVEAQFFALVGGSSGAEVVFLNQDLAIRSTSIFADLDADFLGPFSHDLLNFVHQPRDRLRLVKFDN